MTRFTGHILVSALALLLSSSIGYGDSLRASVEPTIIYAGASTPIENWTVIGPFPNTDQNEGWGVEHIIGRDGADWDGSPSDFVEFAGQLPKGMRGESSARARRLDLSDQPFIDFINVFGLPYLFDQKASVVYVACNVHSLREAAAILLVGSADAVKIWLNGKVVHDKIVKRGLSAFDDAVSLELDEGDNLVVLKIARWRIPWGLTATLEPTKEEAALKALRDHRRLDSLLLVSGRLAQGAPLDIAPRGVPSGVLLHAEISRHMGQTIAETTVRAGIDRWYPSDPLEQGLYTLTVKIAGERFSEPFLIGSAPELAAQLMEQCDRLIFEEPDSIHMSALKRRVENVCSLVNLEKNTTQAYTRSVLHVLGELNHVLFQLNRGLEPFRGTTGMHVRGFRSKIDGQLQYYRVFIPSSYGNQLTEVPLVVMLPTVISADRPFIDSVFMNAHSEAERLSAIAERLGIGVVWSGYRNRPTGEPCEFTHLDEILEAVGYDYAIDAEAVSLVGACSAGAIATMTAVRWPERFAGIGLLNPVFRLSKGLDASDISTFFKVAGFRDWIQQNNKVEEFLSEQATPTFVIHDGAEPGHGDLAISLNFAERATLHAYPLGFEQDEQGLAQHFGAWEKLLKWAAAQRRTTHSGRRNEKYFMKTGLVGSIATVLAEPFVVVIGTGGSSREQAQMLKLGNLFEDSWRKTHYGSCRVMLDTEFAAAREWTSNIVLIGNRSCNSVWRDLGSDTLQLSPDGISVGESFWPGTHLSLQVAMADPADPERALIFIGSNDLETVAFGTMDLSVKGWFGFSIWDNTNDLPHLIAAGM